MINENINLIKKRKCLRVISFITLLVVCFSFLVPLSFSQNNVSASSISFIQQNEYTISLGNVTGYEDRVYNSVDNIYISYSDSGSYSPYFYLSYPTFRSDNTIHYESFDIGSWGSSNSTTYKYINDNVNLTLGGFLSSYESADLSMVELFVERIDININRSTYGGGSSLFGYADTITKTCYNKDGYFVNRYVIRSNNLSTDLMTIYFYCLVNSGTPLYSNTSVTNPIVKIDRSDYVGIEYVYTNPIDDLYGTIINGITGFFSLEIFPNFTLGTIFSIVLGITFISIVLHLLMR